MRFIVQGTVRDRWNDRGAAELRIEAWDASGACQTLLGYALSDADGAFRMHIEEDDLLALFGRRVVTVYFRVLENRDVLLDTRGSLEWRLTDQLTEVVLRVACGRAVARVPSLTPFVVRGTVFRGEGPASGVGVQAFDQGLTSQEPISERTTTDARGNYYLRYEPPLPLDKQRADLVIKVFPNSESSAVIGESPVRCHAPPTVVINVTLTNHTWLGTSRYARVDAALNAALGSTELGSTTEEQREHLACSSGVARADLDAMVAAEAISSAYPSLSRSVVFALVARGFPADVDKFFLHSKSVVMSQLRAALDANLAPQTLRPDFDDAIEGWVEAVSTWAIQPRTGRAGLKELLDAAGVSGTLHESFAQQFFRNEADLPTFWSNLTGTFDKPRIQLAFKWGAFTHGHTPLLEWWKDQYEDNSFQTLAVACELTEEDWLAILDSGTPAIGAPADIPSDSTTTQRQNYAKVLSQTLATALPMVTFRKHVAASEAGSPVATFFTANPSFDFTTNRLSEPTYAAILGGMYSEDAARLKAMERLYRVVPRFSEVKKLLNKGYSSAHQIHEAGQSKFVARMASTLGTEAAKYVFRQACYDVASAKVVFGKYGLATHAIQSTSLPNFLKPPSSATDIPDWKTLFGNAGGCVCEHCKSVLGPAAYFVDLVHWLSQHDVLNALLARRPDLTKIMLTCKSSHTPLPYLDLVNEALEVRVANGYFSTNRALTSPIKTTYEPAELLAGPEIVHPKHHIGAWKAVAAAVHPFTLPRDLWAEEASVYLGWLGTSREEIVRTLSTRTGDDRDVAIARARLGVRDDTGNAGWRLLLGTQSASLIDVWGDLDGINTVPALLEALSDVPTFIKVAGLSGFDELTALIATRYVKAHTPVLSLASEEAGKTAEEECDIDKLAIEGLDGTHLARLHRFIRLARLTGLSFGDLDTLVFALKGPGTIELTEVVLREVAAALSLAERLGLTAPEIAAFYADLDTFEGYLPTSAYRRLFLNKMVDAPDVGDFVALLVGGATTKKYVAHRASLEQALGIRPEDLDLLFDTDALSAKLNLPPTERVVDKDVVITLEGVSELYRVTRLARALQMSVAEFVLLRVLITGPRPNPAVPRMAPFLSLANTEAFLEAVHDVRAQGLLLAEIHYALRGFATEASGLHVNDKELAAARAQAAMAVGAIQNETKGLSDPNGDRAKALLDALVPTDASEIMGVIKGPEVVSTMERRDALLPLAPYVSDTASIMQNKLAGPDSGSPELASPGDRFAYVTRELERYLRGSRVMAEKLAAWAKIDASTATYLLVNVLPSGNSANPSQPAINDFLHPDVEHPAYRDATLVLLRRHALLLRGTRIGAPIPPADPASGAPDTPGELTTFGLYSTDSPLRTLLTSNATLSQARTHFERYLDVARHTALRDRLAGGPDALRTILEASVDKPTLLKVIAEQTGWDAATVEYLAGVEHYNLNAEPEPKSSYLKEISNLRKLEQGVKLVVRVGLAASEVVAFLTLDRSLPDDPPLDPDPPVVTTPNYPLNARDMAFIARRAAKAKVGAEEWPALARKLRDKVRDRVRRALIDWLVPRKYDDIPELFGDMLLDPEMGDCLLSSRIVAATNTVQLFVQRCLLNLETGCELDEDASNVWQWMKTYRLWEANRKVFLYPENYIEPELRDDKTPLYKRLETRLRQGEITNEVAEKALEEYLNGLHEIAKLEVMGVATAYEELDGEDPVDLHQEHVVARTRSTPRKWFYRRRVHERRWSPWEKIDLDIDVETIHLAWHNRRLYLFWPVFSLKPVKDQKGAPPNSDEQAESIELYEIRLAWSAYEGGAWTPTRHATGEPLRLRPAKSETTSKKGIAPEDISIVPRPPTGSDDEDLHLLVVVKVVGNVEMVSEFFNVEIDLGFSVVPEYAHIQAGVFHFDACGGGSWRTEPLRTNLTGLKPVEDPDPARWYLPNYPQNGFFWASQIREKAIHNETPDVPGFNIERSLFDEVGLSTVKLLGSYEGNWSLATPANKDTPHLPMDCFSFEDAKRLFYARFRRTFLTEWSEVGWDSPNLPDFSEPEYDPRRPGSNPLQQWADKAVTLIPREYVDTETYRFELFEHPYVCEFTRRLAADGLPGLLGWKKDEKASVQFLGHDVETKLKVTYKPTSNVEEPFPELGVDFSPSGAYSAYNWELFFHAPFAIAKALHKEGRYAEAQRWLHFIFDPTTATDGAPGANRFWKVKPFFENIDLSTIENNLTDLALKSASAAEIQALVAGNEALQKNKDDLEIQIAESIADPFNPHAIARFRGLAYQKSIVLFYIEMLLDWGDSLFGIGSMETIHEALQLYLLATDLLGPRPTFIKHKTEIGGLTYDGLKANLDKFSNAAVDVEVIAPNIVPWGFSCSTARPMLPDFRLYFCVPGNDKLVGLWDRVADRLFKLRNCLDLEGVARQIPLFQPPIDPALLVRARAAGVRFDQVLQGLGAPAPMYRFVRLHAKAVEFAGAVLDLGRSLLGAIEKKDGEELAALRLGHEVALAEAEREVRKQAIKEARETLEGLKRSRLVIEKRFEHYRDIKQPIAEETAQAAHLIDAGFLHGFAGRLEGLASGLAMIPDADTGLSGMSSAVAKFRWGGTNLAHMTRAGAAAINAHASELDTQSKLSEIKASWKRRQEEWDLQEELAKRELAQIDKQIIAQEIRVAIAEQELANMELRLDQSRDVEAFLRRKFSNVDLYDWMVGELMAEHYQAYQLAFDMAKRAERAYQLERGEEGASFIRFGAWDTLKKGLLAGERLLQDLRSLDHAYLTKLDREREIVKNIALSEINGAALRTLRNNAAAPAANAHLEVEVSLPEALFDADYPGHYLRRIKSVAVTIPAVKPALDSVQCELTLVKSSVRMSSEFPIGGYQRTDSDSRFHDDFAPRRHLATSAGELDSGLFEVNLRDDMLLPFEGAGVISTWTLRIPQATNRFPLHLLSDVILHIRYTARDGGAALRAAALTKAQENLTSRTRVFSLRRDFPTAWALFLRGDTAAMENKMEILFTRDHFLPFFGAPATKITAATLSGTFTPRARAEAEAEAVAHPGGPGLKVPLSLYKPGATSVGSVNYGVAAGEPVAVSASSLSVTVPRRDQASPSMSWKLVATPPTHAALKGPNDLLAADVFEDLWLTVTYGI